MEQEKQIEKNIQKKDIFDKIMALPGLNIFENIYYKYKEVLLYLFFGGLTTVISIGSYSYCDVALHMNPLVANIISWILAVLFAYVTNKIWVFNAERHGVKEVFLVLLVREDRSGLTSGVPVVTPVASPGSYVGKG